MHTGHRSPRPLLVAGLLTVLVAPLLALAGLVMLALLSFGLVAVLQAMFPLWAYHPAAAGLRVHLANGLYANAAFDRLSGGWSVRSLP